MAVISEVRSDVIVHCAAWTAVDAAEDEENKAKVHAINVDGTVAIASAAASVGAKVFYISTDYVFDGQGSTPWLPDCKNYAPINYYGQTKLEGELAVAAATDKYFIVRIAWVFGRNGKNFIKTMLKVAETHDHVRVVNDQIGTPTYTFDLARLLVDMAETDKYGYYHATNEGGYMVFAGKQLQDEHAIVYDLMTGTSVRHRDRVKKSDTATEAKADLTEAAEPDIVVEEDSAPEDSVDVEIT